MERRSGTADGFGLVLIARDRLSRGKTTDLIRASLADYRGDPADYKSPRAGRPDLREVQPLRNAGQIADYRNLFSVVDGLLKNSWRESGRSTA